MDEDFKLKNPGQPERWIAETSPEGSRPAATLILLREEEGRPIEVLMVQRSPTMNFAASAIVFPGGRVDDGDRALARRLAPDLPLEDAASRIAAIRETIEEAGVAVGLDPAPSGETVTAIREALHAKRGMDDIVASYQLSIDFAALVPFARWCPQRVVTVPGRVFDTRFYVARARAGAELATADETESVRLRWAPLADIIADCESGIEQSMFPTRRNLERLARNDTYDAIVAYALSHPAEMITPWKEDRDGEVHLCIPDHLGYPVTSQLFKGVRRM